MAEAALKRYPEAIASHTQAIGYKPTKADYYLNRGWAYFHSKHFNKAMTDVETAHRLDPNNHDVLLLMVRAAGGILRRRGVDAYYERSYREALKHFDSAIEIELLAKEADDALSVLWNWKGLCFHYLQWYESAVEAYSKSIEYKPDDALAWYNRAQSHLSLQDLQEAKDAVAKSLELDPDYADAKKLMRQIESQMDRLLLDQVS